MRNKSAWAPSVKVQATQRRGMATEKQLRTRLQSVTNIQKITKAMKLVAAAKLRQVERLLDGARKFQAPLEKTWPERKDEDAPPKNHMIVCMTGDRGLCGAVNSTVIKAGRAMELEDAKAGRNTTFFLMGEKAKGGLERTSKDKITTAVTELGAKAGAASFQEICLICEHVMAQEYDEVTFIFNKFISAMSYDTTPAPVLSLKLTAENREAWQKYNFEGEMRDMIANLYEFRMAVLMFARAIEGATSEQSARMAAMDNSTNNAGEMIDKLRLLYNRTRQARITTELIEIISGATAAEEMNAS